MRYVLLLLTLCSFSAVPKLEHELVLAEKELKACQKRVDHLKNSLAKEQITQILHSFHHALVHHETHPFLKERETLTQIVHTNPRYADEASALLNQILAYITETLE